MDIKINARMTVNEIVILFQQFTVLLEMHFYVKVLMISFKKKSVE